MSGVRRQEVAAITKSGAKGKDLVKALSGMNTTTPPAAPPKKGKKK